MSAMPCPQVSSIWGWGQNPQLAFPLMVLWVLPDLIRAPQALLGKEGSSLGAATWQLPLSHFPEEPP